MAYNYTLTVIHLNKNITLNFTLFKKQQITPKYSFQMFKYGAHVSTFYHAILPNYLLMIVHMVRRRGPHISFISAKQGELSCMDVSFGRSSLNWRVISVTSIQGRRLAPSEYC